MNRILGALAILLVVGTIADAVGAEKKFEKKFSVEPGGTLNVKTDVGSVSIVGTDAKEVSVYAIVNGRQRDVDEFEITADQAGNNIQITGKGRRSGKWWNWGSNDVDAWFTIKVPREYNARMHTAGGNIEASKLKGKLQGGTSGGDIVLDDIAGTVELETSGGNIRVKNVEGQLTMGTSGGNIRIEDVKGDVDVSTSGGNIALNTIEGKVRAETSGGHISMRVKDSYKGIFAETSGGNIDIAVPKNIAANVDAGTSGGEVVCDLPITMKGRFDGSELRGTINGGGNIIHAHTSGGNIRIKAID